MTSRIRAPLPVGINIRRESSLSSPHSSLSVREIQQLLKVSGVSSAGVFEKDELLRLLEKVEFIPTRSWQFIPSGVDLPPGLEVRIDMKTGKRHARISQHTGYTDLSSGSTTWKGTGQTRTPSTEKQAPARPKPTPWRAKQAPARVKQAPVKAKQPPARAALKWGEKVIVDGDVRKVKEALGSLWEPSMAAYCGEVGTVTDISSDGDIRVEFSGKDSCNPVPTWTSWTYRPEILWSLSSK